LRDAFALACEEPPIFIIGHWRTGTAFLHELLMLDERFTAPTTLECFAPADCMVLDQLMRHLFNFALPPRRPMDNMPVGWDRPQEDEFALMNLGLGSPYEVVVFPNRRRARHPFLDMSGLTPEQIEAWKAGFLSFLQQVNLRSKKEQVSLEGARRIVLKSPYHTARLHILREMFPEAKFIHIVQDPCEVFPSTVQLWRAMSLIMSNMSATEWICFIAISSGKSHKYRRVISAKFDVKILFGRRSRNWVECTASLSSAHLRKFGQGSKRMCVDSTDTGPINTISHPAKGQRCTGAGIGTCTGSGITLRRRLKMPDRTCAALYEFSALSCSILRGCFRRIQQTAPPETLSAAAAVQIAPLPAQPSHSTPERAGWHDLAANRMLKML
jgi:Sulfotransferase family